MTAKSVFVNVEVREGVKGGVGGEREQAAVDEGGESHFLDSSHS